MYTLVLSSQPKIARLVRTLLLEFTMGWFAKSITISVNTADLITQLYDPTHRPANSE
jgi:hypothetical protein